VETMDYTKKINDNFKKVDDDTLVTTTKDGNCFSVTTRQRGRPLNKKQDNYVIKKVYGSMQKHRAENNGEYSPCLTCMMESNTNRPMVEFEDYNIRRLTPVECERLQGFPDGWTEFGKDGEKISDTQRYKCCGNAVTTTVITAIVDEMFDEVKQ
jgi:DNA (cytosine-5)-methyltransferase 1